MSARCRWLLNAAALLAATAGAQTGGQDGAPPVAAIAPEGTKMAVPVEVPGRAAARGAVRDVFAPHSWQPPARPAPKPKPPPELHGPPAPPPPPPPPPLTLSYLGQLDVVGEETVFYLAQGERVFAVTVGDTIAGDYRLLALEGRQLALLYLPLNVKQFLSLGPPPR